VERAKSLWWPLSKDIAEAANRLGLGTLHEVGKAHPRDWENPGRVRVQWKKDGHLLNSTIKTSAFNNLRKFDFGVDENHLRREAASRAYMLPDPAFEA
jgi:signal recognition particle subunit SEC65